MHASAYAFCQRVVAHHPPKPGARVLEIGAYDVNGSPRRIFDAHGTTYYGIDMRPGRGVDEVADGATFDGRGYDYVVCMEVLEHAPTPWAIIDNAKRCLKRGGRLILTAAALERAPHGVDGGTVAPDEWYGNIDPHTLRQWLDGWAGVVIEHRPDLGDVYATAVKP